jgi:hypothetical protein
MSTFNNNRFTPGNKGNLRKFINKEYIKQYYKNFNESQLQQNISNEVKKIQTAMIQLLPEYEIYNSILGKPINQTYDEDIIEDIKTMLTQEDITFYKIKEY